MASPTSPSAPSYDLLARLTNQEDNTPRRPLPRYLEPPTNCPELFPTQLTLHCQHNEPQIYQRSCQKDSELVEPLEGLSFKRDGGSVYPKNDEPLNFTLTRKTVLQFRVNQEYPDGYTTVPISIFERAWEGYCAKAEGDSRPSATPSKVVMSIVFFSKPMALGAKRRNVPKLTPCRVEVIRSEAPKPGEGGLLEGVSSAVRSLFWGQ